MKKLQKSCMFLIMFIFIIVSIIYGYYGNGTNELLGFIGSSIWFLILDLENSKE